ncbi:OmpA family protein [Suttonella sp. R2A3]|uniref:OmpA family protein n=1 Tax=Suttonella sp. R2A3 TaxID=2908648 RepID=UPI001F3DE14C|nr:OmpA family protein [Suttonella sp. R2A3]UJF25160.1 OmpA family protein [Suttonella sp. R2A3]
MKLTKIIAAAALLSASSAFALTAEDDLTSGFDIVVKDNFGNCVKVLGNIQSPECGAEMVMQKEVITLAADTYFAFDKSDLKPEGKQAIEALATDLNGRGASVQKITVVGNTDSVGTEKYNQGLSERRASSVANYLVENGVPAQLIEAYGLGETSPVATNETAEGRAQNRRVDITVDGVVEVAK